MFDPSSIQNLSNAPAYNQALNDISTFENNAGSDTVQSAGVIVNDSATVYSDPNIPQIAKDALHLLVQTVLGSLTDFVDPSSGDPNTMDNIRMNLMVTDNTNYGNSLSPLSPP